MAFKERKIILLKRNILKNHTRAHEGLCGNAEAYWSEFFSTIETQDLKNTSLFFVQALVSGIPVTILFKSLGSTYGNFGAQSGLIVESISPKKTGLIIVKSHRDKLFYARKLDINNREEITKIANRLKT